MMDFSAQIGKTIDEIEALKTDWQQFYHCLPENTLFFSSWEYVSTFVKFYQLTGWFVVAIYRKDPKELVGIFPIVLESVQAEGRKLIVCKQLGRVYAQYTDYLVAPGLRTEVWNAFLNILRTHFSCDAAQLGPMHETSLNYLLLLESAKIEERELFRAVNQPYIETRSQSFAEYRKHKKKSTISDAGRCLRLLERAGEVEFVAEPLTEQSRDTFAGLCRLQVDKFKQSHCYQSYGDWPQFLMALMINSNEHQQMEFLTLRLNGAVIAGALSVVTRGRRSFYLTSYDLAYRVYSPSKVLMRHVIEQSFREKLIFCMGPGNYAYKLDWCQAIAETKILWLFISEIGRAQLQGQLEPPANYTRCN